MSGAYYYAVKTVHGAKYYWNVDHGRWEGLKDNGTQMHHLFADRIIAGKKKEGVQLQYSHTQ